MGSLEGFRDSRNGLWKCPIFLDSFFIPEPIVNQQGNWTLLKWFKWLCPEMGSLTPKSNGSWSNIMLPFNPDPDSLLFFHDVKQIMSPVLSRFATCPAFLTVDKKEHCCQSIWTEPVWSKGRCCCTRFGIVHTTHKNVWFCGWFVRWPHE